MWAIDGGEQFSQYKLTGQLYRLQYQASSRSGNGVVEAGDLKVSALSTPGPAVSVTSGGCGALGGEYAFQGSYFGFNVGDEQVPVTPTDSGGGRSDLLVAQVKDPSAPNPSGWQTSDPPWSFQMITGVAPGSTQAPAGITCVPLARIDIPVSTSAITQQMIHDVREMLSPRQFRDTYTAVPGNDHLTSASYTTWPLAASWQVAVPPWAGRAVAIATVGGARIDHDTVNNADGAAFGRLRWNIGGVTSPAAGYDSNVPVINNYDRFTIPVAGSVALPDSLRGTTVTAQIEGIKIGGVTDLNSDQYTSISLDIEFIEDIA